MPRFPFGIPNGWFLLAYSACISAVRAFYLDPVLAERVEIAGRSASRAS